MAQPRRNQYSQPMSQPSRGAPQLGNPTVLSAESDFPVNQRLDDLNYAQLQYRNNYHVAPVNSQPSLYDHDVSAIQGRPSMEVYPQYSYNPDPGYGAATQPRYVDSFASNAANAHTWYQAPGIAFPPAGRGDDFDDINGDSDHDQDSIAMRSPSPRFGASHVANRSPPSISGFAPGEVRHGQALSRSRGPQVSAFDMETGREIQDAPSEVLLAALTSQPVPHHVLNGFHSVDTSLTATAAFTSPIYGDGRSAASTFDARNTHNVERQSPKQVKKSKMHACPECRREFPRPSGLATHMNKHTGEKPFSCPVSGCFKSFTVRSNARRHVRTHGVAVESTGGRHVPYRVDFEEPVVMTSPNTAQPPRRIRWIATSSTNCGSAPFMQSLDSSGSEGDDGFQGHSARMPLPHRLSATHLSAAQGLQQEDSDEGRSPPSSSDTGSDYRYYQSVSH